MSVLPSGVYTRAQVDGRWRTVDAISLSDDEFIEFVRPRVLDPAVIEALGEGSWNMLLDLMKALDDSRRRLILWKLNEVGAVVAFRDEMTASLRSITP